MPPNHLAMCSKTKRPESPSKNDTPMTCLNMKLRSCTRVIYKLDISVQAMRLSLPFFADNVLIFYTFNVLLLNTLIYTKYFHPEIHIM